MTDYLETSGNLLKPAMEVFGRFPVGFRQVSEFFISIFFFSKSGILPETSAAGFRQVSG